MLIYKSQATLQTSSQSKLLSSGLKNAKGIRKLEKIGMRGRIKNAIKINLEHFDFLKNSLEEISFRFIAFFVKGFFLNLKKDYECFSKDLDYFLELYISGMKAPKEKQLKKKRRKNESQKIISIGNLSIFSQFSEFDKLFTEAFDEKILKETIDKINKKFKNFDFSKLNDQTKKEYLKKFIIEPLSDNLPFTQIFNNFEDNIFTENPSSFAEYINFDLGDKNDKKINTSVRKSKLKTDVNMTDDILEQVNLNKLDNMFNNSESNLNLNNNDTDLMNDVFLLHENNFSSLQNNLVEIDQEYLNKLLEEYTFKNPYLKLDNEINWKVELTNFNINRNYIMSQNSQSQNHTKMCQEAKFKNSLNIQNNITSHIKSHSCIKKNENKTNLERKVTNLIFDSFEEEEKILKKIQNQNSKNERLCDLLLNDYVRFDNNLFDANTNEISDLDMSNLICHENLSKNNIFTNLEEANNFVFGSNNKNTPEMIDIFKQENSKNINETIQSIISEELKNSMNFSNFEFLNVSEKIKINIKEYNLSTSESMTFAFYNCLIVSQREDYDLRQNDPSSEIYIVNF